MSIWFLALPTVELAISRVAQRAKQGGHSVAEAVIRRRFEAGRSNFEGIFRALADSWAIYDNSQETPLLLDWGERR